MAVGDPRLNLYCVANRRWRAPDDLLYGSGRRRVRPFFVDRAKAEFAWSIRRHFDCNGLCGALLSMIQLLPSRELLRQGQRIEIPYEFFSSGSFPPRTVFTLIVPFFFGGGKSAPYKVPYWGVEISSKLRICRAPHDSPLLHSNLAPQNVGWSILDRYACGFDVPCMGRQYPLGINHLLHRLPVYNLFRVTARHMFEFTFSAGVLAALGLTALSQADWLFVAESTCAER